MALSNPQEYIGDGSNREFTVLGELPSESHLRVWFDNIAVSSNDWDLLGNTVLFDTPPDVGVNVQFVVSSTGTDFPQSPTDMSTVAFYANDVESVANNIDDILVVSESISDVNDVANNIGSIVSLSGRASIIDNAVDTITNLSASATSVPAELGASATLIGSNIEIKVPRGSTGADGENGLTPDIEFSYNPTTGNLEYDVVGYLPISQLEAKEV